MSIDVRSTSNTNRKFNVLAPLAKCPNQEHTAGYRIGGDQSAGAASHHNQPIY
jgi:hypothetical protein